MRKQFFNVADISSWFKRYKTVVKFGYMCPYGGVDENVFVEVRERYLVTN